ncbi:MAG TPA: carboxypeptidase-like regulatory domain-containing protein [Vicinamibacterales bacterium]|nr:carboxypeptidase-like regulatory domain-containing protein [Vicinamibacterales bacterium]
MLLLILALGMVHGTVVDSSGGVLPGVTVAARTADGVVVAVAATTDVGRYTLTLPDGRVTLTFSLEGFSPATIDVNVRPSVDLEVAVERLAVAARSETVDVEAHVSSAPASAAAVRPALIPLPEHDRDSVCGPAKPDPNAEALGFVRAGRGESGTMLFAKRDLLTIEGGMQTGLSVGQNVVARRTFRIDGNPSAMGEHTAGVLQIVSVGERTATAIVVYACDEIMRDDWLAPFEPEPLRRAESAGAPAVDDAAKILFADAGQMVGVPRRFMVIDRGRDHGLHAGQRLTLFRQPLHGRKPVVTGDAVIVAVRQDSATIRIEHATDVVDVGDWAAPSRD